MKEKYGKIIEFSIKIRKFSEEFPAKWKIKICEWNVQSNVIIVAQSKMLEVGLSLHMDCMQNIARKLSIVAFSTMIEI